MKIKHLNESKNKPCTNNTAFNIYVMRRQFLLARFCIHLLCTSTASQWVFCSASKDTAACFLRGSPIAMDPQSSRTALQTPANNIVLCKFELINARFWCEILWFWIGQSFQILPHCRGTDRRECCTWLKYVSSNCRCCFSSLGTCIHFPGCIPKK